jgi:hypothetical protein
MIIYWYLLFMCTRRIRNDSYSKQAEKYLLLRCTGGRSSCSTNFRQTSASETRHTRFNQTGRGLRQAFKRNGSHFHWRLKQTRRVDSCRQPMCIWRSNDWLEHIINWIAIKRFTSFASERKITHLPPTETQHAFRKRETRITIMEPNARKEVVPFSNKFWKK